MKQKISTLFLAILAMMVFNSTAAFGQAVGDYVFTAASGSSWGTASNWSISDGAGGYSGTAPALPTTANNVWIPSGITVTVVAVRVYSKDLHVAGTISVTSSSTTELSQFVGSVSISGSIVNGNKWIFGNSSSSGTTFTIDNGASYTTSPGARIFIGGATGSSFTITNNGTFGTATAVADAGPTITMGGNSGSGSVNLTFQGSGTTILKAINTDNFSPACNITIDQDITLTASSAMAAIRLSHSSSVSNSTTRSFTINAGKTVTYISTGWFANNVQNTGADSNNTFNINGTLDVSLGSIYFGCTTNTTLGNMGTTNSQIINIGATGILKCGTVVKVEKPQAGQTLAVNVATGGEITYKHTAFQTFPTAATFAQTASPYALLTNTNSKATFTNTGATAIALNTNLTADNLSLAGATTLTGSANTTINGTLTLGAKLTNNTGNLILGSSATFSGSSANFVDLSSGGSFTRNGVSASSILFPIGTGTYYTPLSLVNTTGTPNITTKVKTTIDNAVEDATKIVNLQWSVVGSSTSTSDITYQFNSGNSAAAFNVASTCDLGNYTSTWSATDVGTPSGSDPYTVSATGLTIPITTNLYVIGNTGQVVRSAPTSTTWSGATDTDWNTASNWSSGVPDNTLDVEIPASLSNYPVISTTQSIKSLTLASGASITNSGTLNIVGPTASISGSMAGNGSYVLAGTDVQTITGVLTVNHLTINNNNGVVNNGTLTINTDLTITAGSVTGTAPVFSTDMPVSFNGSGSTSTGLLLNPSTGNVGTLTINGSGTLTLSNAAEVKVLQLTAGTLDNSTSNITVVTSLTRTAGILSTSPIYSGIIPVTYNGTVATNSSYELSPASGSITVFTLSGSDEYSVTSAYSTTGNISVASGTLKMCANVTAQDITIASGATMNANISATSGSRYTLKLGNGTADNDAVLTVNGTLGNGTKWSNDGIDIEVSANAKTFTINGSGGTIGISGIRPAANANSRALDININQSMYIDRDNGGAANIEPGLTLQNGTCTFARTMTIPVGVAVTFRGNAGLHGMKNVTSSADELINNYASSSSDQGNCTYNINGTLDLTSYNTNSNTGASLNLNTSSGSASGSQAVTVNVGSNGTLKMGGVVKMHTDQAGQTVSIVPATGATIQYGNGNALTALLTTTGGTLPVLPTSYTNLTINTTSGITFPSPINVSGSLTLTAGNINNTVNMDGVSTQALAGNGNTISNLAIANTAGVTLPSSLTATTLTIAPNAKLTNDAGTLTSTTFTIQSDASGTGTYIDNGTSTITTPTVQQYLTGSNAAGTPNGRYWYLTSPVVGSTSNAFTPATNYLWSYNEAGNSLATVYSRMAADASLTPGTGYVARMAANGNINLSGTSLFNDDKTFTDLSYASTDATKKGYNLIGNPYPCYLDITTAFTGATGFETSAWYRSSTDGTSNVFDTFNASTGAGITINSGVNTATLAKIPPMQAFWVRATNATNSLTFSKSTRSHKPAANGNNLRSTSTSDVKQIRLNVSNGTNTDQTLIGFYAQAMDEFDNCDSRKMFNGVANLPEIYSLAGSTIVAINGLPLLSDSREIALGFKTTQAGTFSIKAAEILNLEADQTVILKDKQLNVSQNLTEQPIYSFTSDAVNTTTRFSVVIGKMATALDLAQKTSFDVRTLNNGQMEIALNGATKARVKVYDTVGKEVFTQDIQAQTSPLNKTFSKGIYLVKVSIEGVENTKKVVINL